MWRARPFCCLQQNGGWSASQLCHALTRVGSGTSRSPRVDCKPCTRHHVVSADQPVRAHARFWPEESNDRRSFFLESRLVLSQGTPANLDTRNPSRISALLPAPRRSELATLFKNLLATYCLARAEQTPRSGTTNNKTCRLLRTRPERARKRVAPPRSRNPFTNTNLCLPGSCQSGLKH